MEDLIIFVVLLSTGYFIGSRLESRHYRSIKEREKKFIHMPAVTFKTPPYKEDEIAASKAVIGSVVISIDYFKRFLAGLRNIFGGKISSYETLVDRARREAILRMKEMTPGADMIVNLRIETSSIGKSANRKGQVGSVEALAYGTAIKLKKNK